MFIKEIGLVNDILNDYAGKSIALVTHENPDGDGLAACIALYYCLEEIFTAKPFIIIDSKFPSFLDFLNIKECKILPFSDIGKESPSRFDLLIVLDCHEEDRVDCDKGIFSISDKKLVIDHHETKEAFLKDEYLYFIDNNAVSTGVILHRFLNRLNLKNYPFQKDYADCIYTTILNDTDNFVNSNTDKETFEICASLMEIGLEPHKTCNQFLYKKSIFYYKFIGEVLSTIELNSNQKIASYHATLKMLKDNHQTMESYPKMMRWTKGTFDVEVQLLFQEDENNLWRMSLRSEIHDVAKIAQHFGGGGHKKASGFQLHGNYHQLKKLILEYIEGQIG